MILRGCLIRKCACTLEPHDFYRPSARLDNTKTIYVAMYGLTNAQIVDALLTGKKTRRRRGAKVRHKSFTLNHAVGAHSEPCWDERQEAPSSRLDGWTAEPFPARNRRKLVGLKCAVGGLTRRFGAEVNSSETAPE